MKVLFVGLFASGFEYVENLCDAPSLFDYDAIVVDADHIWAPQFRDSVNLGKATEIRATDFPQFSTPLKIKLREAKLLLDKGGIIACLMRPATIVGYSHYVGNKREFPSRSSYDWIPINYLRDFVIAGSGVRTKRVKSSPFDDYLKLKELEWLAYISDEFQRPEFEIIATNEANLAVAAKVGVGKGAIYFLPIASHEKLPEILMSDLARAAKIKLRRPIPSWINEFLLPGQKEIDEKLKSVREELAEIKSKEESLQREFEKATSIGFLLYERDDVFHETVEDVLNELGFKVQREGDKDLVTDKDPSRRVVFEVTGTEGIIDVDKLRQLVDYVQTEEKSTGKTPKSVLVGNHQIDVDPNKRTVAFTDRAVQQSKVYGTCLLPSVELFKAIVAFRESRLDANTLWKDILATVGIFSFR
jgi:hypothetical protein